MNISFSERQEKFIRDQVASGNYTNASEVVREAIRELEHNKKTKILRELIAEAEVEYARGEFIEWTPDLMDEIIEEANEADRLGLPIPDHVKP